MPTPNTKQRTEAGSTRALKSHKIIGALGKKNGLALRSQSTLNAMPMSPFELEEDLASRSADSWEGTDSCGSFDPCSFLPEESRSNHSPKYLFSQATACPPPLKKMVVMIACDKRRSRATQDKSHGFEGFLVRKTKKTPKNPSQNIVA